MVKPGSKTGFEEFKERTNETRRQLKSQLTTRRDALSTRQGLTTRRAPAGGYDDPFEQDYKFGESNSEQRKKQDLKKLSTIERNQTEKITLGAQ